MTVFIGKYCMGQFVQILLLVTVVYLTLNVPNVFLIFRDWATSDPPNF